MTKTKPLNPTTNRRNKRVLLGFSCCVIVAGLLLLPYLVNYYFSPDELIRNTITALESLTGTRIEISRYELSLIRGLTFYDVRVVVPKEKIHKRNGFGDADTLLLDAETFHIRLLRKGLFGLKLRLGDITVVKPQFHLAQLKQDKTWNWQMLFGSGPSTGPAKHRTFGVGPAFNLVAGRILMTEIDAGRHRPMGAVNFSAEALPQTPDEFYRLTLHTWTPQAEGPIARLDYNPRSGEILAGKIETLDLQNLGTTLPEPYKRWFQQLTLAGTVRVPEISYHPNDQSRLTVILENVQCNVPLSESEFNHPDRKTFLRVSQLAGKIVLTRQTVQLGNLSGKLNGSPCRIAGTFDGVNSGHDNMTFNVRAVCTDLVCPDYLDPAQMRYIEDYLPWQLSTPLRDYKPRGRIGFDLLLCKSAGPKIQPAVAGIIQAKGVSAEYFKFPYRLDNLTGSLRVAGGGFQLIGLTGFSGGGKAVVNGTISEPRETAAVVLDITALQLPLDKKLHDCLPKPYQAIWDKFNLAGATDMQVSLRKPQGRNLPWARNISASFIGASGCYERFKYPLTEVAGIFRLDNDRIELENLSGRNGSTRVTFNGTARGLDKPKPTLDIKIAAQNVRIDRNFVDLLPPVQGQVLRDCALDGQTDVEGAIRDRPGQPFDFEFACELKSSRMCYRDFPYPINDLSGKLAIQPGKITISGLYAASGLKKISGSGTIYFSEKQNDIVLKIGARNVPIDTLLYNALDPSQRALWNSIQPGGKMDMEVDLRRPGGKPWDWKVDADLHQVTVCYKRLSQVNDLHGKIVFGPHHAEVKNLAGKINGQGPIAVKGTINSQAQRTDAQLTSLNFEGLDLSHNFLDLMDPSGVVKGFKWRPGGTASGRLKKLSVAIDSDGRQRWTLDGQVGFTHANVAAFDPSPVDFGYAGNLTWTRGADNFSADGQFTLGVFDFSGRKVRDITARLRKSEADSTLNLDNLSGTCAGGQVSGMGKITFEPKQRTYAFQLMLDNLDAAGTLGLDPGRQAIGGKMRGEVFLVGEIDQKFIRMGGGTLEITGTQVLRIPLMAKIYQTFDAPVPNLATFHDITAEFALERYRLNFQHIDLTGPSLNFTGMGTLNTSNDIISLDLIAANPKTLKRLPVIQDLVAGASQELSKIEVRGNVKDPVITAQPLKGLSEPLEMFFEGRSRGK